MKILFISDNFPPEVNAPASRTYEHAKRWTEAGAEVTVITCAPNFPKGIVHDGYSNAWRFVENIDGIRVVRVKTYITGNAGFAKRILDYLSFMVSAVVFGLFETRPSVVVGTSPQFFAALGAWLLSVAKRRPFVFELRDLWPASIVTVGVMKKGFLIRRIEDLELFLYRRADLIISVTQSFVEDLVGRGVDREKIRVVRNGVDLSRFRPKPKSESMADALGVQGSFVVGYLGTHGMAHALGNIIDAAKLLESENGIVFLLVGDGAEKPGLVERAEHEGVRNVMFHDSVSKSLMPDVWSVCDVSLVHLRNDPVFSKVIPSKVFESFGMGKPILIAMPDGEAVDMVRSTESGEWVRPEEPRALADTVLKWRDSPELVERFGRKSAETAERNNRDALANTMLDLLNALATGRRQAEPDPREDE